MAFHDNYVIDPEFQAELPVNDDETIERLEIKLVKEGCLDPIRVWKGQNIVVDGMTRIVICRRLDIKFKVVEMEFEDREDAKLWIIENQLARRDLTDTERKYCIGKVYNARLERNKNKHKYEGEGRIREQLAEEVGKSPATIFRLGEMAEALDTLGEVDKEIKDKILNEEIKPTYQEIKDIASEPMRSGRNKKVKAILNKTPATVSLGGDDDPAKVYDGLGNVVTDVKYHEVFVEIVTFNEILRDLRGCESRIKRLAGTAGGVALHVEELTLTRIKSELDCRIPWCVCMTCKGQKTVVVNDKRNECPSCGGLGFLTKFNYERLQNKGKKK